jgi:hypothetical protein
MSICYTGKVHFIRDYRYKGLTLVLISILLTIFLSENKLLDDILFLFKDFPYIESFIAGILYASASTAALGILLFSDLVHVMSPIEIAIIGGLGVATADLVIFKFFRGSIMKEITPLYKRLGGDRLTHIMHHRLLQWSLPIIGGFIIASPFPDEVGIILMGISQMKTTHFIFLSFLLNSTGLFLLASAFSLFQ